MLFDYYQKLKYSIMDHKKIYKYFLSRRLHSEKIHYFNDFNDKIYINVLLSRFFKNRKFLLYF